MISTIGLVGVALLASCSDPSSTTLQSPLGTDAELYGEWDVNHHVPSVATCAEAGISDVEVVFFRPGDTTTEFTNESLRIPCADGFYDSSIARVVRAGDWNYRWRAYSGTERILESMLYSITAVAGEEFTLHAVDFLHLAPVDLDIALRWKTDTAYGTCAEAFVDTMSWELRTGSATGALEASSVGSVPCATSIALHGYAPGALSVGAHTLVVTGLATDSAAWAAECVVAVPEGGPATASCDVLRVP